MTTTICFSSARSIPTIALRHRHQTREAEPSRALRLRSPRDTPLPLPMNVLLLRWDTKPAAHQGDVPTSGNDTQNVFLCRVVSKSLDRTSRSGTLPGDTLHVMKRTPVWSWVVLACEFAAAELYGWWMATPDQQAEARASMLHSSR